VCRFTVVAPSGALDDTMVRGLLDLFQRSAFRWGIGHFTSARKRVISSGANSNLRQILTGRKRFLRTHARIVCGLTRSMLATSSKVKSRSVLTGRPHCFYASCH
jgi:hypothetical protein